MFREWTVQRAPTEATNDIFGIFTTDDRLTCLSLERHGVEIPAGRYEVTLTESARAKAGTLWSPFPVAPGAPASALDYQLPLIKDVPGHTGERIHAFNMARQSLGCIGVGTDATDRELHHSRPVVTRLVRELASARRAGDRVFLTVLPAKVG